MNKDIIKNTNYNKISRNGILENDKYGIMKKFGFMSSFMSTTFQSRNKSINEEKNLKTESSNLNIFLSKSFAKKNKSASKPIVIKTKSISIINPIVKEDIPMKKCHNIFCYAQKMNFKTDKKINQISIISKSFINSYSIKKYSAKNQTLNNKTNEHIMSRSKSRIKSIVFNQLSIMNHKNRKKIESYEKIMSKNYKLKYKFLFGRTKKKENIINKRNSESNTLSIISNEIDDNNVSTKREKNSKSTKENNILFLDNNSKYREYEADNFYNISNKYSSENVSDSYNMNNFNVLEPCKNFNSIDEHLCELDNDISEKRSNDNNIDNNSNFMNNMTSNNFIMFSNKEKDAIDKYFIKKNFLFSKLSTLLKNNDMCDLSSRNDLNDFSKINNHEEPYEKKYKFISDIQKNAEKFPSLNINKFLNLEDDVIYRLMGFMFDYSSKLIRANSLIKNRIKKCFHNIFSNAIKSFSMTYSSFLEVIDYYFENRKLLINKKNVHTFNLVIIAKVTTKELNKSYDISYNYISSNKEYDNLWKIDIKSKSDIKIWLHTELFKMNNYSNKFTYSSQISSFSYGDEIKFEINIFNEKQQINPESIQWLPLVITDNISNSFEANKFITNQKFDPLRCNELELQALIWEEVSDIDNNILLKDFINVFKKFFLIKNIFTYTSKHTFYKIKIIPKKEGIFHKNKYHFYDLNIIGYDQPLRNEIQSIYLMNTNYYNKIMDIRIGTEIIFYITDYKS